jgi:hypothetical protein
MEVKKRMSTIKQIGKGDNVHQSPPPNITQLYENNYSKNVIKNIFDVNLHHGLIKA